MKRKAACARDGCKKPRKSDRAKFCDDIECKRVRARERQRASARSKVAEPQADGSERPAGGVFAATIAALTDVGRMHTPAGQNALALATRIDWGASDTGSSLAALSKQHLAALTEALRDVQTSSADPVDELRNRREARGA